MDEEKEKAIFGEDHSINYPVKPSSKLLIVQVVLLQGISFIALLFLYLLITFLSMNSNVDPTFITIFLGILLILAFLADLILTLVLILRQAHTLYIIRPKEIVVYEGVLETTNSTIYSIEKAGNVAVEQTLIGKILNYGNIILFGETKVAFLFRLNNIPNPQLYAEIIRHAAKNKKVFELLPKKAKPSAYKTALST